MEDYSEIMDWFILAFGRKKTMGSLPLKAKRTFYKLNFLAEDKLKEEKQLSVEDDDE